MDSLHKELVFLVLQFLGEEKYKESIHKLERESGVFFNMTYFEELVVNGEWDEVEKYLSGFTKVDENRYSMKIFFEIRKQKYLEALDKRDYVKAVQILVKDLKVFKTDNEELFKEMTELLALENIRENERLSKYGDTKYARGNMLTELKMVIEANPSFHEKLQFPTLKVSRLKTLINHSVTWQHHLCKNPKPSKPDITTLFTDHTCGQLYGAQAPSPVTNSRMGIVPNAGGFPPIVAHDPFQGEPALLPRSFAGLMPNPNVGPSAFAGPMSLNVANNAGSEHVLKRPRPFGISDEANNMPVNIIPVAYTSRSHGQNPYSSDDLPKNVVMTLNQGSAVKSMDFHPMLQMILLVGTNMGDIVIWALCSRERLAQKKFTVWDIEACSMPLQASLANDSTASINRVMWSPDGSLFGVAYSKHIVHIYSYHGNDDLRNHLEIEAHVGSVHDLAFSCPNKQLLVITCGEDKAVKVWDAVSGAKQFTFDGHETPVYSVCPHHKENIQFILSAATDGKIKAWLYDNLGSRVNYDAPGHSSSTMAYSADGTRLFSCGTNKEGDSLIVEWDESEGAVKRTYHGLGKQSVGIVQFDTTKNRFLAAGDEFMIKFWDMDNVNLLTIADAEGGLPASPCIRFNKEGILLAVSTNENGIKILANVDGIRLLRIAENRSFDGSRVASMAALKAPPIGTYGTGNRTAGTSIEDRAALVVAKVGMNNDNRGLADVKRNIADEAAAKTRIWKLTVIKESSQCRSLRLPDTVSAMRISSLIYTNSGLAILALASNAIHKLWKWQRNNQNSLEKATASVLPQLWQPAGGILMANEISDINPEDAVSCFALSKNDSYVISASGGNISLFNMINFKAMTTFMPPPPAATFLVFHPQDNNIIAIGMDDSSIQIYNVQIDEVIAKLKCHQKRITGLAFSLVLNVLVSSGADCKLCVWSTGGWEKQTSNFLQIPERAAALNADTRVQFHQDQIHLLATHWSQIAIYEAPKLECLNQWVPCKRRGNISHATYSCDSQSIYVSTEDGCVGVLATSDLRLRCLISPTSYLASYPRERVYPLVITAHPSEPNQFALGLTDGGVIVLEPLESEGKWGTSSQLDKGAGPSTTSGVAGSDHQPQR